MFKRKKTFTIEEALSMVQSLESKCTRMPELLGFKSQDISKSYKQLMTHCNSLAIVFTQYGLFAQTISMLKRGSKADSMLLRYADSSDKLWKGRIIHFNNQAYLSYRKLEFSESLKHLYQSETILCCMRESGLEVSQELSVSVNMLTFIVLWKLKRYKESVTHLEYAASIVNAFIKGIRPAKYTKLSLLNLYALVIVGLAGLTVKIENDWGKALNICEEGYSLLKNEDIVGKNLICNLIQFLEVREDNLASFLISPEYDNVFYLSVFIPFISPYTPVIANSELENARNELSSNCIRHSIDSKRTASSIAHRHFKVSPRRGNSLPRGKGFSRPWWEKKKFVNQIRKWNQDKNTIGVYTPAIRSRLKPIQINDYNKHIMLEFATDENNEHVNLLPIEFKEKKRTALDLFN